MKDQNQLIYKISDALPVQMGTSAHDINTHGIQVQMAPQVNMMMISKTKNEW